MNTPKARFSRFVIVISVFAVAFLIGVGLCGLDFALAGRGIGKSQEEFGVGPLDSVSIVVMVLSVIGLVLTSIIWVIVAVAGSFIRKESEPQRLFEEKDKEDFKD